MDITSKHKNDMRNIGTILFLIIGLNSIAQKQEIKFESKFKPDLIYTMTFLTNSKSVLDFEGPKNIIDKIKANGTILPMVTENTSKFITKMTTDSIDINKNFKAIMEYGDIELVDKINGEEKKSHSPVSGLIIKGVYDEKYSFQIDTMISETLDQNLKNTLKASLEGIHTQIKFPEKPMKIGDSFDQNISMPIPIADLTQVKVNIKTNYTLNKIKGNKANFNLKQTVSLDLETNQFNVKISGGGEGTTVFDIKKMYVTKNETNLVLDLALNVNDLVIKTKIKSTSKHKVKIENSNAGW